jgi:hypothetical protein
MTDTRDKIIEQLRNQIEFLTSPQMQVHTETMRDRFAMAALTSFKTNADVWHQAKRAYEIADAMLEARLKGIK